MARVSSTNTAMFNSTGNNFGAGSIQFKDYQAEHYVVLNAIFSYDPTNVAYQAANVLEIYVPDLSINRSAITGVFMRFQDRYVFSSSTWNNDGGTVLKSWIKDKNTICIEKLTDFDTKGDITIFIQALYPQQNQGSNTVKGTKKNINVSQPTRYLYWGTETYCVIFEHWVFLHMQFDSCSYDYRKLPWECTLGNFPSDVNTDVPLAGGTNQYNPSVNGMSVAHIENGVFMNQERTDGFFNTGYTPFIFAFLVRDSN